MLAQLFAALMLVVSMVSGVGTSPEVTTQVHYIAPTSTAKHKVVVKHKAVSKPLVFDQGSLPYCQGYASALVMDLRHKTTKYGAAAAKKIGAAFLKDPNKYGGDVGPYVKAVGVAKYVGEYSSFDAAVAGARKGIPAVFYIQRSYTTEIFMGEETMTDDLDAFGQDEKLTVHHLRGILNPDDAHAMVMVGVTGSYLIVQNSWGDEFGFHGRVLFPISEVRRNANIYSSTGNQPYTLY